MFDLVVLLHVDLQRQRWLGGLGESSSELSIDVQFLLLVVVGEIDDIGSSSIESESIREEEREDYEERRERGGELARLEARQLEVMVEDHSRLRREKGKGRERKQDRSAKLFEGEAKASNSLVCLRDEVDVHPSANRSVDLFLRTHNIDGKSGSLSLLQVDGRSFGDWGNEDRGGKGLISTQNANASRCSKKLTRESNDVGVDGF